jgi:branched-chain amino acid transport system permease protein
MIGSRTNPVNEPAPEPGALGRWLTRALAPSRRAHRLPDGRWRPLEVAFWIAPVVWTLALPSFRLLASQVFITGLFALSLDLILGYAGIV